MRILFLTNNFEKCQGLADWLDSIGERTIRWKKQIRANFLQDLAIDFVISYCYAYLIREDVIDLMKGKIINLHNSFLPWNRGVSPNIWSFIDVTPLGVTIHQVDKQIDTGEILVQKQVYFDDRETLRSSYDKLHEEVQELFKVNWDAIKKGEIVGEAQGSGGTAHSAKDFSQVKFLMGNERWDISIHDLNMNMKTTCVCV